MVELTRSAYRSDRYRITLKLHFDAESGLTAASGRGRDDRKGTIRQRPLRADPAFRLLAGQVETYAREVVMSGNQNLPSPWRLLGRLTSTAAVLLLLAGAAALGLDVVQMITPRSRTAQCPPGGSWWIGAEPTLAVSCRWATADETGLAEPRLAADIGETDGTITARLALSLPGRHPLVDQVRRGEAGANPDAFISAKLGYLHFDEGPSLEWTRPTVTMAAGQVQAVITLTGTERRFPGQPPVPADRTLGVSGSFWPRTVLTVTAKDRQIGGIRGPVLVTEQNERKLVGDLGADAGSFELDLTAGSPQPYVFAEPAPKWLRTTSPLAGSLTTAAGYLGSAALAAVAWLLLHLAEYSGLLGTVARRESWKRFARLSAFVLGLHGLIVGLSQLASVTSGLWWSLTSKAPGRLVPARLFGWDTTGYSAVNGAIIVLTALALGMAPRWFRGPAETGTSPSKPAFASLSLVTLLAAAASVWATALADEPWSPGTMVGVVAVELLVLGGFGLAAEGILLRLGQAPGPFRGRFLLPAAISLPLATLATVQYKTGALPGASRLTVLFAAGAALALGAGFLVRRAFNWAPKGPSTVAVTVVCLAVAIPWRYPDGTTGWNDLLSFGLRLDGILGLVLTVALVTAVRQLGIQPVTALPTLHAHRSIGIAATLLAITGYSLVSSPSPIVVAGAGLLAWALFPLSQVPNASAVLATDCRRRERVLEKLTAAGTARRALSGARKDVRDKVADGSLGFEAGLSRVTELEQHAFSTRTTGLLGIPTEQLVFGSLHSRRPWKRAGWCAGVGAALGAPWTLLGLLGARLDILPQDPYPVLTVLTAVGPLMLTWAGFGFVFGYFFPLFRGPTGLAKATWLFVAIAVTAVLEGVVGRGSTDWRQVGLGVAQDFAVLMTLGLLADRKVLRGFGTSSTRLAEVHNLWWLSAWGSSVAVALAGGVATIIIGGFQPFVMDLIHPPVPSPAATAPPTPPTH
ncbi:hypothetical protein [Amycolatopsis sp. NPDC004169]|uniref:hypothetical protein n=1 Tax=Amycolatopsis sp. NPDC004169 TaxID=3154453 RepID=UPI0033BC1509